VRGGQTTTGIDASLEAGGALDGTLTDPSGTPVGGAMVAAVGPHDGRVPSGLARSAMDGTFTIMGLRPGEYRLLVIPPPGSGLTRQWVQGARQRADAAPVDVRAGQPAVVDVRLVSNGSIEGAVGAPDGVPAAEIWVFVYPSGNASEPAAMTRSDAQGRFAVNDLAPGRYVVLFAPSPETGLLEEWFNDASTEADAEPIEIEFGSAVQGVDAVLRAA
jgi:hypothetical protein